MMDTSTTHLHILPCWLLMAISVLCLPNQAEAFTVPNHAIAKRIAAKHYEDTKAKAKATAGTAIHIATTLQAHPPSWDALEGIFGAAYTAPTPVSIDSVLHPETPTFSTERPTLFRERHGWCPYSERVWLTLEALNVDYDTIRIDNTGGGRPSYYGGGQTPQLKWPDGKTQGESYDLVQALDATYGNNLLQCDATSNKQVNDCVNQFRTIFPRARPSSRAAYLFQYNGEPLGRSTFETTLQQTDALLGQTKGPFFCGDHITGADIAWAPFLERYRYQLPCLHDGLEPDDPATYPHLAAWYTALESQLPAYACRVKGDASSWRKVLTMAGFGNAGLPPNLQQNMQARMHMEATTAALCVRQDLWDEYATSRPYVASTPSAEAALIMTRNRERILADLYKQKAKGLPTSESESDSILRELVAVLAQTPPSKDYDIDGLNNSNGVGKLASFLDERMCVPRDMGAMSAACIKDLAWKLSH